MELKVIVGAAFLQEMVTYDEGMVTYDERMATYDEGGKVIVVA